MSVRGLESPGRPSGDEPEIPPPWRLLLLRPSLPGLLARPVCRRAGALLYVRSALAGVLVEVVSTFDHEGLGHFSG